MRNSCIHYSVTKPQLSQLGQQNFDAWQGKFGVGCKYALFKHYECIGVDFKFGAVCCACPYHIFYLNGPPNLKIFDVLYCSLHTLLQTLSLG